MVLKHTLVTHRFSLADIKQGYEVFGNREDGVLKVLITP
jgi:threonine dehydrogenase-like Zn-dependent dehydrogenase